MAAVTVNGGQMVTNFYVVTLAQGDPLLVGSGSGAAQWLSWTGSQSILAVCDSRAVLYNASGGERAAYDFTGRTLRDISVDASGNTALLLASGQLCQAVMLGRDLGVENTTQVQASNRIVRAGDTFICSPIQGWSAFPPTAPPSGPRAFRPARRVCWPTAGSCWYSAAIRCRY